MTVVKDRVEFLETIEGFMLLGKGRCGRQKQQQQDKNDREIAEKRIFC